MRTLQVAMTTAVLLIFSRAMSSDWPNFRGPRHDGFADEGLPNKDWKSKPPKELWRIELGDDGYAGPSVSNGKLFIIDHKENRDIVRAVDLKTGKNAWTYDYEDTDQANYGFARSTPTCDSGRVYTLSRLGVLNCLDTEKGTPVWKRNIKTEFGGRWRGAVAWDYAGSPLIDGDKVIVCPGGPGASVAVLDKATGKDIWKGGGDDQAGYSTPVKATIDGRAQYVVFTGLAVMGVDAASGAKLWSSPWHTSYDVNAATPLVIGNQVFITSNYGAGCAMIDAAMVPAKELWRNKALKAHFNSPIFYEGNIYGTGDPGELNCIDPANGATKWKKPGFEKGGVAGIDGMIIAIDGRDGDVVLCKLSPQSYTELGRIKPLGGQSWTAPIIANGKLFVRNKTGLVCLDLNP
jgi:outer membrane protein assembly factor BamB